MIELNQERFGISIMMVIFVLNVDLNYYIILNGIQYMVLEDYNIKINEYYLKIIHVREYVSGVEKLEKQTSTI